MTQKGKSCTFWMGKSRVLHEPSRCSRSGACSQGRAKTRGGGRVGLGCGTGDGEDVEAKKSFKLLLPWGWHGPVWPLAWLPGHPKRCRTSWVQCCPLAIPGNLVVYLSAGKKGVVFISSRPLGRSFRAGKTARFYITVLFRACKRSIPLIYYIASPSMLISWKSQVFLVVARDSWTLGAHMRELRNSPVTQRRFCSLLSNLTFIRRRKAGARGEGNGEILVFLLISMKL